jgi:hypothetical protein
VTDQAGSDARRLAVAVLLAAVDGRDDDLHALLADADHAELAVAVAGLALAFGALMGEVPTDRRPVIRDYLAGRALDLVAWASS